MKRLHAKKDWKIYAYLFSNNRCHIIRTAREKPKTLNFPWADKPLNEILLDTVKCIEDESSICRLQWTWAAHLAGFEVRMCVEMDRRASVIKGKGVKLVDTFKKLVESPSSTPLEPSPDFDINYDMDLITSEDIMSMLTHPLEDREHLPNHDRLLKALSDCWIRKGVQLNSLARAQREIAEIDKQAENLFLEISQIWGVKGVVAPHEGVEAVSCLQSPEKRFSCEIR